MIKYTIIIPNQWPFLLVSTIQYYIHYSISLSGKKKKRQGEGERERQFWKSIFQYSRGKIQPRKQWNQLYISVWIGRLDGEGGGQSRPCEALMRAVQQGLLAGAAPPGELSLSSLSVLPSLSLSLLRAHGSLRDPRGAKL